ncbi:MAG: MarC family protein [Gammaproteobacteria bacterium]
MLLLAARITGLLGETGTNVITRVLGVILTALAVQYILNGLLATFPTWAGQ